MNFYQKITGFITLCIMGITLAIVGVCFNSPYTDIFIVESIAILVSELFVGISAMILFKKSDTVLPFSWNFFFTSLLYLIFTLIMIIPALYDIRLKYFILCHSIGFALTVILYCIFAMGEHNIKNQEVMDKAVLSDKKKFYLLMHRIVANHNFFNDNIDTYNKSRKILDDLRFAADSRAGMADINQEISEVLSAMQTAVQNSNMIEYRRKLDLLENLYREREEYAKLL